VKGMRRPAMVVVPRSAVVPRRSHVRPAPNCFTHEVRVRQPFTYGDTAAAAADGEFAPGTKVVLMVRHRGDACRVVDALGRYVRTAYSGLRPLTGAPD
jgi:hypothetical protein